MPNPCGLRLSNTVQLTSCLFGLDSNALLMLNAQKFSLLGSIQASQTGGQLYSDTSPYGEGSMGGYQRLRGRRTLSGPSLHVDL